MAKRENGEPHILDTMITDLQQRTRLDSWREYIEEIKVPANLLPGLMTGRAELIKATKAQAGPLSADEHRVLLDLIAGIVETNAALREHAQHLAVVVNGWAASFVGLQRVGSRIAHFANFRRSDEDDDGVG